MAKDKFMTGISINPTIAEEAKIIGERLRWTNFSQIVEMGLELFIAQYGQVQLPGLEPLTQDTPAAQTKRAGVPALVE